MTKQENMQFIKNFFDSYYSKLYNEAPFLLANPCIPSEMISESEHNDDEWKIWKLVPSRIDDAKIKEIENQLEVEFPEVLKCFFMTYHHMFEEPIGRNPINEPFVGLLNAFNESLAANGYLPFVWDEDHYFIRCFDLQNMPDEEKCAIVEIDHEEMFDLIYDAEENSKTLCKDDFAPHMRVIAENFYEYLNCILESA